MGREARENEKSRIIGLVDTATARMKSMTRIQLISPIAQNIMFAWVGSQGILVDMADEDRAKLAKSAVSLANAMVQEFNGFQKEMEAELNREEAAAHEAAGLVPAPMEAVEPHLPPGALESGLGG